MDKIDRKYLGDGVLAIILLLITIGAFIRFPNPSVLFAWALALTFFVTADIVLSS